MRADMIAQQALEHVGEAEHCIDRHAFRAAHGGQRMKGTENEARAIDENEMGRSAHAATDRNEVNKKRVS
ncbi:hypothetical protein AA105894_3011 [Asaia spathodeae NBRC 105894]|nr:hypothetical protein AA105894_3011 [Asaia spathodeae NBRC 105894]